MEQETTQKEEVLVGNNHLGIKDLLKLSVRAFKVRPLRTFLTILGMSVGIGTVFFLISLGYGLQNILIGKLAPNDDVLQTMEAFYPGEGGVKITQDALNQVKSIPGVAEVSPMDEVPGEIALGDVLGTAIVRSVDNRFIYLTGTQPSIGATDLPKDGKGVIVSSSVLKLLNLPENAEALGSPVGIQAAYQVDGREDNIKIVKSKELLPIVGIIKDEAQAPFVVVNASMLDTAPSEYSRLYVRVENLGVLEQVRSKLIEQGFIISAKIDTVSQARNITTAITITLAVFGIAALIVSAIGMFNTMLISFMERIFEVGIMKSIGATRRDILNLFIMESFVMGFLGGVGGILLGMGLGELVNLGLNILARYLGGKPVDLFIYPMKFVVLIIVLSCIVGVLAGFWPARRAAKLSAREAFLRK